MTKQSEKGIIIGGYYNPEKRTVSIQGGTPHESHSIAKAGVLCVSSVSGIRLRHSCGALDSPRNRKCLL